MKNNPLDNLDGSVKISLGKLKNESDKNVVVETPENLDPDSAVERNPGEISPSNQVDWPKHKSELFQGFTLKKEKARKLPYENYTVIPDMICIVHERFYDWDPDTKLIVPWYSALHEQNFNADFKDDSIDFEGRINFDDIKTPPPGAALFQDTEQDITTFPVMKSEIALNEST